MSKIVDHLPRKMVRLHKYTHAYLPSYKQNIYGLPLITQHIFDKLNENPRLAKRDLPKLKLLRKNTLDKQLVGELNLSHKTFRYTGRLLIFYILRRKRLSSYSEIKQMISRTFNADLSYSNLKRVNMFNIVQIALDLDMPLETLIYGTGNIKLIALYNYVYFDDLSRFEKEYVAWQARHNQILPKCVFRYLKPKYKSYQDIADQCGVSRQSVSYWATRSDNATLIHNKLILDRLCKMAEISPVHLLRCRRISHKRLQNYADSYIEQLTKNPKKRWLNDPIKWKSGCKKN